MNALRSLVRQVHLLSGLTLAVAVLFYALSGALLVRVFPLPQDRPHLTTKQIPLPAAHAMDDRALGVFMDSVVGTRGRLQGPERLKSGGLRLRSVWPGTTVEVELPPDRSMLTVTRTSFGGFRVLRILHTLTGYSGGAAFVAWSILLDLVALAMLGFAASGIFLWYRMAGDRRLGWLILGGSWCYTLGVIAYLFLT